MPSGVQKTVIGLSTNFQLTGLFENISGGTSSVFVGDCERCALHVDFTYGTTSGSRLIFKISGGIDNSSFRPLTIEDSTLAVQGSPDGNSALTNIYEWWHGRPVMATTGIDSFIWSFDVSGILWLQVVALDPGTGTLGKITASLVKVMV